MKMRPEYTWVRDGEKLQGTEYWKLISILGSVHYLGSI